MNRIPVTIREANACTVNAWLAELDAFPAAMTMDELEDVTPAPVVAALRKAIAAHEDALLLLRAAMPARPVRGETADA